MVGQNANLVDACGGEWRVVELLIRWAAALNKAAALNPFVAEPHIVRAQLLMQLGQWAEAEAAATLGVSMLCECHASLCCGIVRRGGSEYPVLAVSMHSNAE